MTRWSENTNKGRVEVFKKYMKQYSQNIDNCGGDEWNSKATMDDAYRCGYKDAMGIVDTAISAVLGDWKE